MFNSVYRSLEKDFDNAVNDAFSHVSLKYTSPITREEMITGDDEDTRYCGYNEEEGGGQMEGEDWLIPSPPFALESDSCIIPSPPSSMSYPLITQRYVSPLRKSSPFRQHGFSKKEYKVPRWLMKPIVIQKKKKKTKPVIIIKKKSNLVAAKPIIIVKHHNK